MPLKLIMILFYAHWEIKGGLYQNLPINATEIPQLTYACDRTPHEILGIPVANYSFTYGANWISPSTPPASASTSAQKPLRVKATSNGLNGCRDKILASLAHCYRSALRIGKFPCPLYCGLKIITSLSRSVSLIFSALAYPLSPI